ncbi:MAG: peptidoglycan DD-metalloendopeptidase family protein [Spirochaetales bacterium]|nr:peptidoglycan DD-metalloendopeptidase family protein [Spirochaetales bacterium]
MGRISGIIKRKGWESVIFTVLLTAALFLQISVSRNTQATTAALSNQGNAIPASVPEDLPDTRLEIRDTYIEYGSSLAYHLGENGISTTDTMGIIDAVRDFINLRKVQAGQKVELRYENNYFEGIMLPVSTDRDIYVTRSGGDGFQVIEKFKELDTYPVFKEAVVDSSLYASCLDSGIQDNVIMDLIELYSFDIDFQRDIQKGDHLTVTYELVYNEDNEVVDTGNILFTTLKTGRQDLQIYRYEDSEGKADFYNENGQTVRKTLLKTPINGAYITSAFGPRTHPITGFSSVHKGIDFGAPRGTPIKSSGDGTVTYAGYNDVFGYHVRIRHVNGYTTMYAHMSAFGRGIRQGRIVDQGQTIGYVGSTGMSTGPHLHYEVRYNGSHINPSRMKFPPGKTLAGVEAELFHNMLSSYEVSLP